MVARKWTGKAEKYQKLGKMDQAKRLQASSGAGCSVFLKSRDKTEQKTGGALSLLIRQ